MENFNFQPTKLAKVAAVFCVLTVLGGLLFYAVGQPFAMKDAMRAAKATIAECEQTIKDLETEQVDVQDKYDKEYEASQEEIRRLEKKLDDANDALDVVCSESSFYRYSSYRDCRKNNYACESLHKAVTSAEDALDNYKDGLHLDEYQARRYRHGDV